MADVFLSYARSDRADAECVQERLESCGWSVWLDAQLVAGHRYQHQIECELKAAKCVVVLWSRQSLRSDWVLDEASYARREQKLVPALIEDVEPPPGFRQIHSVRLRSADVSASCVRAEWQGLITGVARLTLKSTPIQNSDVAQTKRKSSQGASHETSLPFKRTLVPADEARELMRAWVVIVVTLLVLSAAAAVSFFGGPTAQ